jgi:ADP-ribosylglycohydrolase
MEAIDRFRGCLAGLAVGDALGTTLEFASPGTFTPISDMVGGGPFGLSPGHWTDDTSMALCLAESLLAKEGFDPADQMERYVRWYRTGHLSSTGSCFDVGNTVRAALRRFERDRQPYAGSDDSYSAGNGSIMRLAPVPMFYGRDATMAIVHSGNSSRTTHAAVAAVDACRYLGGMIYGALNGVAKSTLLSSFYAPVAGHWVDHPLCAEIEAIALGSFKELQPPQIAGTGYVVKSLEAALWAFYHSDNYRDGCLLAANLGDDADTTAAVHGQLAGAYYGVTAIPVTWLEKLVLGDKILSMSEQLYRHAHGL